jgi:diaminopimelate epimerase
MEIKFFKYQGTGNDFVMIDGRGKELSFTPDQVATICDRRFGIGADGLIILREHATYDFEMDYYNADGSKSFCGNGSRCAQAFAQQLGIIADTSYFLAIDGTHYGKSIGEAYATKMGDVSEIELHGDDYFIDTGSPHYIKYVANVDKVNVEEEGRAIRNSDPYKEKGTNVNFVAEGTVALQVRTYERGVEGETYSCGTGVTAVAISFLIKNDSYQKEVAIQTKGGPLSIRLEREKDSTFKNIWLVGPAELVFKGELTL